MCVCPHDDRFLNVISSTASWSTLDDEMGPQKKNCNKDLVPKKLVRFPSTLVRFSQFWGAILARCKSQGFAPVDVCLLTCRSDGRDVGEWRIKCSKSIRDRIEKPGLTRCETGATPQGVWAIYEEYEELWSGCSDLEGWAGSRWSKPSWQKCVSLSNEILFRHVWGGTEGLYWAFLSPCLIWPWTNLSPLIFPMMWRIWGGRKMRAFLSPTLEILT